MREKVGPDCNSCKHFYVTWDADFPYGCKGFQMKTKRNPSTSVLHASGKRCMLFLQKNRPAQRRSDDRKA